MTAHRFVLAAALALAAAGCGGSSSTAPVILTLLVAPPPDVTNQGTLTISGTTDASAQVSVTSGAGTATRQAGADGSFSVPVTLVRNQENLLSVKAVSAAGDSSRTVSVSTLHDDQPPNITVTAPTQGATTIGQSGFNIQISFADSGAGVDPGSFSFTSQRQVGGVYLRSARTSAVFEAGAELKSVFQVTPAAASWFVPDTLAWSPGPTTITVRVSDRAGNIANLPVQFTVTADPDALMAADAAGARGQRVFFEVGLRNAVALGGVQFDLALNANAVASVDSAFVIGRAGAMRNGNFAIVGGNSVRVVLVDGGGNVLAGGQGGIVRLWVTLRTTGTPGAYNLGLTGTVVSDPTGLSRPVQGFGGTLTLQ